MGGFFLLITGKITRNSYLSEIKKKGKCYFDTIIHPTPI